MSNQSSQSSARFGHSLRKLPWDKSEDKNLSQKLISSTAHEWYDVKHRMASEEEINLVNTIKVNRCPRCGSLHFIHYDSYKSGIFRYYCDNCHSCFNPLTNTNFEDKKIPISEWIEYLIHLFEFHSITSSARDNLNAYSTGRYCLFKVFSVLEYYQDDIVFEGTVILGETFFTLKTSKIKLKEDGKKYRGISRNKLCVACVKDDKGHVILLYENTSKYSF